VQKGHVVLCPGYFLGPIVGWMRCHGGCNCAVEVFTVAMAGTSRCLFENRGHWMFAAPMGGWRVAPELRLQCWDCLALLVVISGARGFADRDFALGWQGHLRWGRNEKLHGDLEIVKTLRVNVSGIET
jgi:hypothetical protein